MINQKKKPPEKVETNKIKIKKMRQTQLRFPSEMSPEKTKFKQIKTWGLPSKLAEGNKRRFRLQSGKRNATKNKNKKNTQEHGRPKNRALNLMKEYYHYLGFVWIY